MLNFIQIVVLVTMSMYVQRVLFLLLLSLSFFFFFSKKQQYLGSIEVLCSMKTLDFENRTKVARDSIRLVSAAAGIALRDCRKERKKNNNNSNLYNFN